MSDLIIPVNGEYFDQIKAGTKKEEFRLITDYWKKRLINRHYDSVILTRGYPRRDDKDRRHVVPYRGFVTRTIQHKHFGDDPVLVFAIDVSGKTENE